MELVNLPLLHVQQVSSVPAHEAAALVPDLAGDATVPISNLAGDVECGNPGLMATLWRLG